MIRILGLIAIALSIAVISYRVGIEVALSIAVISYRVGIEVALYHASLADLVEAARLRVGYYVGANQ